MSNFYGRGGEAVAALNALSLSFSFIPMSVSFRKVAVATVRESSWPLQLCCVGKAKHTV